MNNIVLNKESDDLTIKEYFIGVHELLKAKGSNAICINLDDVWPLVYDRKDHAIRQLRSADYYEGVDFQASQNGKVVSINQLTNGIPVIIWITVPTLETLVARKERRVFEVYRQVFHAALEERFQMPKTFGEALMLAAKQQLQIEEQTKAIEVMKPKADYFDGLIDRNHLTNFRDTAKEFGLRQNAFINWLLDQKYIYRDARNELKPYNEYVVSGLFEMKDWKTEQRAGVRTMITTKGKEQFRSAINS